MTDNHPDQIDTILVKFYDDATTAYNLSGDIHVKSIDSVMAQAHAAVKMLVLKQKLELLKAETMVSVFVTYDGDNGRGVAVPQTWINDSIQALEKELQALQGKEGEL